MYNRFGVPQLKTLQFATNCPQLDGDGEIESVSN